MIQTRQWLPVATDKPAITIDLPGRFDAANCAHGATVHSDLGTILTLANIIKLRIRRCQ